MPVIPVPTIADIDYWGKVTIFWNVEMQPLETKIEVGLQPSDPDLKSRRLQLNETGLNQTSVPLEL